ncbi:MAG: hypothetical protein JWQ66_592 [Mucilaginibacter sp.]|nr:hypothetical protein [Mucilaginibacter sp.]
MITEERISDLENKILEQERLIAELYQAVVNHQQMINDRTKREIEIQDQLNSLSELVITITKRFV